MSRFSYKFLVVISVNLASCATAPKYEDNSEIKIDKEDKEAITLIDADSSSGIIDSLNLKNQKTQWLTCNTKKPSKSNSEASKGRVMVFHDFKAGYSPEKFCTGWIAQSFLLKGFSVLAVNRPSYVGSLGKDDLSGVNSVLAVRSVVENLKAKDIVGLWGYDSGAIAASFYAKRFPEGLKWIILGGGIYDLEVTLKVTSDKSLVDLSNKLKSVEGESFYEKRSIAWDYSGLPKIVGLYHAKDDLFAPISQADSFNDQLRTSEYKVFRNEIKEGGHDLPWKAHMKILTSILDQILTTK